MSQECRIKSMGHEVQHVQSGRAHYFHVKSRTGKEYETRIQVSCTCPFMSIVGQQKGKICSHIIASMKLIVETGGLDDFCRVAPQNPTQIRPPATKSDQEDEQDDEERQERPKQSD